ncbi:ParB N-terminal domain-containing protein [Dyella humicola]|uniref:ParB N-terminal domain-containing protein n=1 Tax=Dyella humicola TaxID=2992126 RepID=UPI003CE57281
MDPNGSLPPIVVAPIEHPSTYKYRVMNGFHRFYASAQRGYPEIPILLNDGSGS